MALSLKSKLFYKFVRHAMKKYVNNEQLYIKKRCPGQDFNIGEKRNSKYKAPKGYIFETFNHNNLNCELLKLVQNKTKPNCEKKIIYMLHGGAYHLSMTDMYNGVMKKYSNDTYDVFTIDYRTAPKDPYPAALNDAIKGFNILLNMGYLPENIIMVGDSAGAGLALAMALKLRDDKQEFPKNYILSSPWVDLSEKYSIEQKESDILFGWGNVIELCASAYANNINLKNPYISPIYGDYTGFENTQIYISVANGEMFQSANKSLVNILRKAGATVIFDELDSGMHAIITMYALGTKEVKDAWKRIHKFLISL